jgi:prevent-host-death family protein
MTYFWNKFLKCCLVSNRDSQATIPYQKCFTQQKTTAHPICRQTIRVSRIIRYLWNLGITDMIRVSSTEFGKEVGRYQDAALSQPVVVTGNGRDRTVMISAEEYRRLKKRAREVLSIEDFTEADIEAVRRAEPSKEAEAFNHELKL